MQEYSVRPEMNPTASYVCIGADKGNDLVVSFVSGLHCCYVSVHAQSACLSFSVSVQSLGSQSERFCLDCSVYLLDFNYMEMGICSGVGELIKLVSISDITEPTIHYAECEESKYSINGS